MSGWTTGLPSSFPGPNTVTLSLNLLDQPSTKRPSFNPYPQQAPPLRPPRPQNPAAYTYKPQNVGHNAQKWFLGFFIVLELTQSP